jgi:hypothetical protein
MSITITITKAGHYMSKVLWRFLTPSSTHVRVTTLKVHAESSWKSSVPFLDTAEADFVQIPEQAPSHLSKKKQQSEKSQVKDRVP